MGKEKSLSIADTETMFPEQRQLLSVTLLSQQRKWRRLPLSISMVLALSIPLWMTLLLLQQPKETAMPLWLWNSCTNWWCFARLTSIWTSARTKSERTSFSFTNCWTKSWITDFLRYVTLICLNCTSLRARQRKPQLPKTWRPLQFRQQEPSHGEQKESNTERTSYLSTSSKMWTCWSQTKVLFSDPTWLVKLSWRQNWLECLNANLESMTSCLWEQQVEMQGLLTREFKLTTSNSTNAWDLEGLIEIGLSHSFLQMEYSNLWLTESLKTSTCLSK